MYLPTYLFMFSDVLEEIGLLRESHKRNQMELTNKRVQIDSLSSRMSSLARHHKNLLSKNNELSESIQRISQNIDQLKAVVWIKTIRVL